MAAQHLSGDLKWASSGFQQLAQTMKIIFAKFMSDGHCIHFAHSNKGPLLRMLHTRHVIGGGRTGDSLLWKNVFDIV